MQTSPDGSHRSACGPSVLLGCGWWGTVHAPRPQEITGERGRRGRRGSLKPAGTSETDWPFPLRCIVGKVVSLAFCGVYIPAREPSIKASLEELEMLVKAGGKAQADT